MRKSRLLNSKLVSHIANLGHRDETCFADAGLPIPITSKRIDISLERGTPTLFQTLDVIAEEAVFEEAILANELDEKEKQIFEEKLKKLFKGIKIKYISHGELKDRNKNNQNCIVRTGENTPYYNVILISGVYL